MNKRQAIYDELCRVLTDYEGSGSSEGASASGLYDMLVKIQNSWEDIITAEDNNLSCSHSPEDIKPKNCKLCGAKMVWENPRIKGRWHESSCNIDDWPICHECMVEHCCQTNCLSCKYGKYPDCQFLDLKQHYMSDD